MTRSSSDRAEQTTPDPRRSAHAASFEAIFRADYDDLYAAVYRVLRSRPAAEEVVQDTFLVLWNQRERWGDGELADLRRYLFATVRNRAISRLRRERVESTWQERAASSGEYPGAGEHSATTGVTPEGSELLDRLEQAIAELPPRTRDTLLLRMRRQLRNSEIADVLGISVKAVEGNLARAMHILRLVLGPRL